MTLPTVSVVIPTLNSASILENCLRSLSFQNYPQKQIEIIIADGGSTDNTTKIAKKYSCRILLNPLKTGEAGKAIGVYHASGKFILLLDSDNILPGSGWLKKMIKPLLLDQKLIGSEPIKFTYRCRAGFIERYSALIGANDPFAFVTGVYDRTNYINHHWTNLNLPQTDKGRYLIVKLQPNQIIPTIGANGTIFRASFLKKHLQSKYLFDIDIITQVLYQTQTPLYFAKVKTGIIHTFCEASIRKFIRKQQRRLTDYYIYRNIRSYNWQYVNSYGTLKFALYTLLVFPALIDSIHGFINQPDPAWFFHPLACLITLSTYGIVTIKSRLGFLKPLNRYQWHQ